MQLTITLDDREDITRVLQALTGGTAPAPSSREITEKAPSKPKAANKAATPAEEPAGDEGPTLDDAVSAATALVSNGEAAKVKAALSDVGAKRVSELKAEDIPAFLAALGA